MEKRSRTASCSESQHCAEQDSSETSYSKTVNYSDHEWELLQTIFPDEIWLEILSKCQRSAKETVYASFPYFRHLLFSTRQQFLFPSVWSILGEKFEFWATPGIIDFEVKRRPYFEDILCLRLVCKDWCSGVDELLESRYPLFSFEESVSQLRVGSDMDTEEEEHQEVRHFFEFGQWAYSKFELKLSRIPGRETGLFYIQEEGRIRTRPCWEDRKTVGKFLEHFRETHECTDLNPFVGRHVIFTVVDVTNNMHGDAKRFCTDITELLSIYGKHIWSCYFSFGTVFCPITELLKNIMKWLTLMPNLKVVTFNLATTEQQSSRQESELQAFKCNLETRRISFLPNLKLVKFFGVPNVFAEAFLTENSHVTMLEAGYSVDIYMSHLPNLKHLSYGASTVEKFEQLENCSQKWQLESLHFSVGESFPYVPMERFFRFVEKWQDTLIDVVLELPKAVSKKDKEAVLADNSARLNLPKVKRFKFETLNISPIDFLLPMKALELLEIGMALDDYEELEVPKRVRKHLEKNQVIKFIPGGGNADEMYSSNIWKLFPKLKRIHTNDESHTAWVDCDAYVRRKWKEVEPGYSAPVHTWSDFRPKEFSKA